MTDADLRATDADGVTIGEALAALGYREPLGGGRLPAAFVEVHIEQGPVLERRGLAHAVVTSIAGMSGFTATITGSPGHAGTTPMEGRRDALLAAAELALALRERATRIDGAVVTVGRLTIADAAANVIPGRVTISIDARCPTAEGLEQLIDGVGEACSQVAAASGCAVALDPAWRSPPVPMSARVGDAIRQAAAAAGLELADLASGGGHDAGILAEAGVESGMLFVRSRNGGVSHRPEELTDEADVATAIRCSRAPWRPWAARGNEVARSVASAPQSQHTAPGADHCVYAPEPALELLDNQPGVENRLQQAAEREVHAADLTTTRSRAPRRRQKGDIEIGGSQPGLSVRMACHVTAKYLGYSTPGQALVSDGLADNARASG